MTEKSALLKAASSRQAEHELLREEVAALRAKNAELERENDSMAEEIVLLERGRPAELTQTPEMVAMDPAVAAAALAAIDPAVAAAALAAMDRLAAMDPAVAAAALAAMDPGAMAAALEAMDPAVAAAGLAGSTQGVSRQKSESMADVVTPAKIAAMREHRAISQRAEWGYGEEEMSALAVKIQAVQRGKRARAEVSAMRVEAAKVVSDQQGWNEDAEQAVDVVTRRQSLPRLEKPNCAADDEPQHSAACGHIERDEAGSKSSLSASTRRHNEHGPLDPLVRHLIMLLVLRTYA